jgi:hypothetical protein
MSANHDGKFLGKQPFGVSRRKIEVWLMPEGSEE